MRHPGDDHDDLSAMWGVPLDEPLPANEPATLPFSPPAPERRELRADEHFLLRGEEPPTDGVYRPRLRGFGDAA